MAFKNTTITKSIGIPDFPNAVRNLHQFTTQVFYILLVILLFSSCNKDKTTIQPNPTISFIQDSGYVWQDTTLAVGETFRIGIRAESQSDVPLTNFNYTITAELGTVVIDSGIYTRDFNYERIISKSFAQIENWAFTVRDKDGRPASVHLSLFLADSSEFGNIVDIPSVVLGAQNQTSIGSFYSWESGLVYSLDEAFQDQQKINLLYFYDLIETDENTIASPGANIDASVYPGANGLLNWTIRNTVRFEQRVMDSQEFYACTNDSLILATNFEFNSGKRKAKNLKAGDIYAFNNNSKKGLFRVKEVNGAESGSVEIEIKVQE
ncbi:MAG: hypothetical protein K9H64_18390 [Bacteroidales bacterium]|nr:hypothetical protein [Bacteroidales bacterium]MCF8458027.1 hypothetical protein [Bacteroidales bacterium]